MRCKSCNYALWNIERRVCPECGSGFKPSDFTFVPDSIRFMCPHCRQEYYGTSERGHLTPRRFACVGCKNVIDMDETILAPADGVTDDSTEGDELPWLERRRRGFWRAWLGTIAQSMVAPNALAGRMRDHSPTGPALGFALLTNLFYSLLGGGVVLGLGVLLPFLAFTGLGKNSGIGGFTAVVLFLAGMVAATALVILLVVLLWAALAHAVLAVSGGTAQGIGGTVRCFAYSSGANAMSAVPCLGMQLAVVSWVWWAIAAIFMLRTHQRVSAVRASVATLAPPLTLGVTGAVAIAVLVVPLLRQLPAQIAKAQQLAENGQAYGEAKAIRRSLLAWHDARGAWPEHALAAVIEPDPALQILPSSLWLMTQPVEARTPASVAGVDMLKFRSLLGQARDDAQAALAKFVQVQPKPLVAHRVGDVVLCYHGVKPADQGGDPNLWLAVFIPPQRAAASTAAGEAPAATEADTNDAAKTEAPSSPPAPAPAAANNPPAPGDKVTAPSLAKAGETVAAAPAAPANPPAGTTPTGGVTTTTINGITIGPMIVVATNDPKADPLLIALSSFTEALRAQNALRAEHGLEPLADPRLMDPQSPQTSNSAAPTPEKAPAAG